MGKLNEILNRLKQLEDTTKNGSNFSRLTEIASFMDDLADITQQMEQGIIDWEGEREDWYHERGELEQQVLDGAE